VLRENSAMRFTTVDTAKNYRDFPNMNLVSPLCPARGLLFS